MKYFWRFALLTAGFALTSAGLMAWQGREFSMQDVMTLQLHPVHLLVLGLAMIPPALWEIFLLEARGRD